LFQIYKVCSSEIFLPFHQCCLPGRKRRT